MEEQKNMQRDYVTILELNDSGGFAATVPELPECKAKGDSIEETLEKMQEVISEYLKELQLKGEGLPKESCRLLFTKVKV